MAKLPTVQRLARQVAETAICEVEYKGKTISEWCELFCKGDLVEVVRCSECKYFGKELKQGKHSCLNYQLPYCLENDYCGYGERKDSEQNGL